MQVTVFSSLGKMLEMLNLRMWLFRVRFSTLENWSNLPYMVTQLPVLDYFPGPENISFSSLASQHILEARELGNLHGVSTSLGRTPSLVRG